MNTAIIPATDPTTVAMIVILSPDKPPPEAEPLEDVEVGDGCPATPTFPGVAVWQYIPSVSHIAACEGGATYLYRWVYSVPV